MEVIEHDGKQYIRADGKAAFIAETVDQIQTLRTEIDENQTAIDELETAEVVEDRQQQASSLLDTIKDIDTAEALDLFDFNNEDSFNSTIDYFKTVKAADYGDPNAGFGPAKQRTADGKKELYQQGRQAARNVRRGRR